MTEEHSLDEVFLRACKEHGNRRALVGDGEELTYDQFAGRVRERAAALGELLADDDRRVAIHAANSVDYLVSYYALVIDRRLPLLVDAQFGALELQGIDDSCGVDVYLTDRPDAFPLPATTRTVPGSRLALATPVRPHPRPPAPEPHPATATCRFTSGTTGAPKCLEFSHAAIHSAARAWADGTGLRAGDRVLCLAAFTNGLAFNTSLLPVFLTGAELHLYRGLPTSGGITRALRRSRATRLVAFPLAYRLLTEAAEPDHAAFATVTRAISAAAALDPAIRSAFHTRYGIQIADYYGIAETGPCTFERDAHRTTGLGTPLPGVTLRIDADPAGRSQVHVRTASMATRCLNVPGALEARTGPDGFYATGDTGSLDAGRLHITGRIGGPINLAGRKIDPTEIERVALALDGVLDCVCFADTDTRGETVLHLVLSGPRTPRRAEVVKVCQVGLAPYKVPGRVSVLEAIPRSSAGKVRLSELRELLRTGAPAHDR
ncbi:class I adenylate-forming enzyme family protein [Streptomyces fagopyri]|uniref:class I adenylate-forming enzyme family protein n=1 Tax=Streptomyces fagopyri TaxID=2662397 RepID=UPI003813283E